jgi:DNA-directed RNA polymerase subunit alpha
MNISLAKQPQMIQEDGNTATIVVENLFPGYGLTLGNALRRVLLSSLPGAAIAAVKIEGVEHEFSTIPHIKEDVIEIILNLKKQRFRLKGNDSIRAQVSAKGEGAVTGKAIKGPSELEVVSQKALIATLTDPKARLEMELIIRPGLGYVTAEEHKRKEDFEVGMIVIDSIFSPVLAVNFRVENMRVGERTDYNALIFSIETDGTITPAEAFQRATQILVEQYKALEKVKVKKQAPAQVEAKEVSPKKTEEILEKKPESKERKLRKIKIQDLKFSKRTESALVEAGVRTVGGILQKGEADLRKVKGLGDKAIKEIRRKIGRLGSVLEG